MKLRLEHHPLFIVLLNLILKQHIQLQLQSIFIRFRYHFQQIPIKEDEIYFVQKKN